jgi:2-methylcitrate dehydratase
MDKTSEIIVDFVDRLSASALSARVLHEAKRLVVDSVGCAIGAIEAPPARVGRALAGEVTSDGFSATAIGVPRRTTVEMATFANGIMVRYLDFNDMYFSPTGAGGHPSDLIPGVLATGEAMGASGREVLLATVIAYEVNGALAGAVWLRERGWDQGFNIVAASAMAAGKLLGLSRDELGHALSLAVTPNIPVRQTRVGELSMWKGCATANAARNGVFAARLASKGVTGPPNPFEGRAGIWEQVTGPFELAFAVQPESYVIERISTKFRPAEYNSQGPLDLIVSMRNRVQAEDIERMEVETYYLTFDEIGDRAKQPEKWDPRTRETADHSLAYMLAVALVDGDVGLDSFTPQRVADPALRPLMNRISIAENPDFSTRFPAELMCRITIQTKSGAVVDGEIAYPKGHRLNRMSDDEINLKFDGLVGRRGQADAELSRAVRSSLWELEKLTGIAAVLEPLGQLHAS